jgi:hypothetical protein
MDACVGDDDVEPAEPCDGGVDGRLHRCAITHVGECVDTLPALPLDQGHRVVEVFGYACGV